MKKAIRILLALGLTACLALLLPRLLSREEIQAPALRITRVWITEEEPAVTAWLKKRAAAYEKQGGSRVYLRAAARDEVGALSANGQGAPLPDLIILPGEGENTFRCRVTEVIENPFDFTVMLRPLAAPADAEPLGWEMEKPVWQRLRGDEVTVHIPADAILQLRS